MYRPSLNQDTASLRVTSAHYARQLVRLFPVQRTRWILSYKSAYKSVVRSWILNFSSELKLLMQPTL